MPFVLASYWHGGMPLGVCTDMPTTKVSAPRQWFGLERNHYDRVDHVVQGAVSAVVVRELSIRCIRPLGVVRSGADRPTTPMWTVPVVLRAPGVCLLSHEVVATDGIGGTTSQTVERYGVPTL
ncbi:DUF2238 domain-containing protein [Actinokineospora spheciospongiae]|nr:DUF2238 domain-containing protein [Actinokineospora spheciospongiae]PWW66934.1 putative membrane protein DUF2238 [Actinokineospora spheciospongiae]